MKPVEFGEHKQDHELKILGWSRIKDAKDHSLWANGTERLIRSELNYLIIIVWNED